MSGWTWTYDPDDYGDGLAPDVEKAVQRIAAELAVVNSMVFLDGITYQGLTPGLRNETGATLDGRFVLLHYLTDVRGERIVIVSVTVL